MRGSDSGPMLVVRIWFEPGSKTSTGSPEEGFRARIVSTPDVASVREETQAVSSRDAVLEAVRGWLDSVEP